MEDLNRSLRQDASKVDLNNEREVQHWLHRFNITEEELRRVVEKVGDEVDSVVKELEPIRGTA